MQHTGIVICLCS